MFWGPRESFPKKVKEQMGRKRAFQLQGPASLETLKWECIYLQEKMKKMKVSQALRARGRRVHTWQERRKRADAGLCRPYEGFLAFLPRATEVPKDVTKQRSEMI